MTWGSMEVVEPLLDLSCYWKALKPMGTGALSSAWSLNVSQGTPGISQETQETDELTTVNAGALSHAMA